jgi:hypothetical protein
VHAAEYAIVLRLQELENSTGHGEERAEMKHASADLRKRLVGTVLTMAKMC